MKPNRATPAKPETAAAPVAANPATGGTYERNKAGELVRVTPATGPQVGKSERKRLAAAAESTASPDAAPSDDATGPAFAG